MAQKVTVDGIEREIVSGFTTINGVKKEITKGIVFVNGSRYEVPFAKTLKIVITGTPDSMRAYIRVTTVDYEVLFLNEVGTYEFDNVFNVCIISYVRDSFEDRGVYLNEKHLSNDNLTISTESSDLILTGTMTVDYSEFPRLSVADYAAKVTYSATKAVNKFNRVAVIVEDIPTSTTSVSVSWDDENRSIHFYPFSEGGFYTCDENCRITVTGQKAGASSYTTTYNNNDVGEIGGSATIDANIGRIYYIKFIKFSSQSGIFQYTGYRPKIYDDSYWGWYE